MNGKENGGSPSQERETGRAARKIADATKSESKVGNATRVRHARVVKKRHCSVPSLWRKGGEERACFVPTASIR